MRSGNDGFPVVRPATTLLILWYFAWFAWRRSFIILMTVIAACIFLVCGVVTVGPLDLGHGWSAWSHVHVAAHE